MYSVVRSLDESFVNVQFLQLCYATDPMYKHDANHSCSAEQDLKIALPGLLDWL